MQINRNILKAALTATVTGAALLVPVMPAGATTTTTTVTAGSGVATELPCGESRDSSYRYWRNCETHPVKISAYYIDGWTDRFCVAAGATQTMSDPGLLWVTKLGDSC
ncbi:hypothetical protein ACFVVL_00080 [Kitasatospora sp. NPDC058115]|uniref:hypothetical protein n=1 Tax=Kitasatospora sp. NPDC058115 TaxID=3346347 RepID=UPI0036DE4BA6